MANILSIGQTALTAAQVGLTTAGHNISNANTAGYSRQVVVQTNRPGQQSSYGFTGAGTEVSTVKRIYNDYLANQVLTSQTSQSSLNAYYTQVKQINNMFADGTVGVSPALQEFFQDVQNLASAPPASSGAARQTMLSAAQTLAGQFQDVNSRLAELREGVNTDIRTSITSINSISGQIAKLNQSIAVAQASNGGQPPNDLLDQRDKLVSDLSKEVKVTVVKQGTDYNISVGNGQSLIVGGQSFELTPVASATDPERLQVGYVSNGKIISLAESSLTGGNLGGLLEFRSQTLDRVQNELGRIAMSLASEFNAQHHLGLDLNATAGGDFFSTGKPQVNASTLNTGTAVATASITNTAALTASDYRFEYVGPGNYRVTRLNDGAITSSPTIPMSVDGVNFEISSGTLAAGDVFLVKPTINGAASFNVVLSDPNKIAAASPVLTNAPTANLGSGKISPGAVSTGFSPATVTPAIMLGFNDTTGMLSGFPAVPVTVTSNGTSTTYAAGAPVPYTEGATISFANISFSITGSPKTGDTFTIGHNTDGKGDNRNAVQLGALQTSKVMNGGTATLQGAFGQMVNLVGNKTHEIDVNMAAETASLAQAVAAQQAESGVNLDEEAANLLRYQQAYQAAGKVMQIASKLFDTLLSLGQ
ncbi:flagellar hook-associated protein 1 FlgK [Paucimonas lemoignei]|uniref:Flagellar hook-associated protein 1 n=1 Tax=Paucimonas lemoignei TaxID=29443 RepID=A0A4R3I300_PAULE|nr:flagellar hook-associated protein FlgK [Paucimonas lemoignei]TCS39171.1 flagellar hook-associated protein 1 FlgK [Paucimonas lemoignei]